MVKASLALLLALVVSGCATAAPKPQVSACETWWNSGQPDVAVNPCLGGYSNPEREATGWRILDALNKAYQEMRPAIDAMGKLK